MGLFTFGTPAKGIGRVETIIGADASLRGSYNSKHSIRVDGEIYGNVVSEDGIILGPKGLIRGNITAKTVLVGGRVKGNITAYQRLEFQSTARVEGDLSTPTLFVEEGAQFEGNSQMEEKAKVLDMPKARDNG
ncbi:MAG TPA: polymer-forming cytoskeletal protein [bacterium]|nr:polymer-forming cytoskeletal protein [bacterium]